MSINRQAVIDHYPFPRFDDIMVEMQGCDTFCKIDLEGAYQQLKVEDSSKEILTANTHKGLLQFDRLVEGVLCAGSIFQSPMDEMLHRVRKARNFIDDIILGGKGVEGCKEKLEEVLDRLNKNNVKINLEKSEFFKSEIEYLGHLLTDEGLKPCENKVKAIKQASMPKNVCLICRRNYMCCTI